MKIKVFEPPMCCSTGLCGPSVDPLLVEFSANLDWLKRSGVEVERYNLSQTPAAFVGNETVRELLQKFGNDCLPLVIADGAVAFQGHYPEKSELAKLVGLAMETGGSSLKFVVQAAGDAGACCSEAASAADACATDERVENSKKKGNSCCS
ncbi:MAG: arsenite efflux transporter metallochaperone ArsD [Candidatus Obscuribacter sp.]|nr:arsenite efflux transporter metallochaperone ArsD [Candidatus Obscuribacter sp.]MBK9276839.1 arsenite efflux transporter metallochaperone ArsD [Candidatus Obscuribacter sp.]